MNTSSIDAQPGDWYINTDIDERVAVIDLEDWGFPVAILQYEDGVLYDEALANGDLPDPYQPLPTANGDGPTIRGACPHDEHVFDVEPKKTPHSRPICKECRLSMNVLMEYGGDLDVLHKRVPHICYFCETTLGIGDERVFVEDIFICSSCYDERWDPYANRAYDDLEQSLMTCENSPMCMSAVGDCDDSCGVWMQPTPDRTKQFLRHRDYTRDQSQETCPECNGHLRLHHRGKNIAEQIGIVLDCELPDDPEVTDLVEAVGSDSGVLSTEHVDAYRELRAQQRKKWEQKQKQRQIERTREESVFETLPTGQLHEVDGKPTEVLRNHEPGCQVIGWPSFDIIQAQRQMGSMITDGRREHPRTSDKRTDSELWPGTVDEVPTGALGRASGRARPKQASRRPQFGRWSV
jgi:hypothetical protein